MKLRIKIDLGWVFPGLVLFVLGVLVLVICIVAFLIWIFARYDLSGVVYLTIFGILLLASGVALFLRGFPFWRFIWQ